MGAPRRPKQAPRGPQDPPNNLMYEARISIYTSEGHPPTPPPAAFAAGGEAENSKRGAHGKKAESQQHE
eukprot:8618670-Pyramimonas_sp.AAC.1